MFEPPFSPKQGTTEVTFIGDAKRLYDWMIASPQRSPYRSMEWSSKPGGKLMMQSLVRFCVGSLGVVAMLVGTRGVTSADPLNATSLNELRHLYKQLIDAENAHDVKAVAPFVWDSSSTLFVAKTENPAQGNWAGFWGKDVVLEHFSALYAGTFHMAPDYAQERVVGFRCPTRARIPCPRPSL
jgi:hypothetical protein